MGINNTLQSDKIIVSGKNAALSCLRIFATIMIVASHAWSTLTENPDMFHLLFTESVFLKTAYSLTKWCVPAFFMITGVLLLNKDKTITIKDCFGKYTKRMILALVIFGIPYAFMILLFQYKSFSWMMIPESLKMILCGESFGHLWYLYTLIGIYLFLPFIKLFVNHASKSVFQYVLLILFVFNFCFPLINSLLGISIAFKLPLTSYPLFYMLMGYYIHFYKLKWSKWKLMAVLGIVLSAVVIITVGLFSGPLDTVMSYASPVAAVFTISIFILFNSIQKGSSAILWKIDRLCFGVYLIHPLFIHLCYKFFRIVPTGNQLYPLLSILFAVGFVLISFVASWLMSLIKPLRKYVL